MSFVSFNFPSTESLAPRDPAVVTETSITLLQGIRSRDEELQLRSLQKLRKITFHESNRPLIVNVDSGLIPSLVTCLETASDEVKEMILRILQDLSNHSDTKREIILLCPHICHVLVAILRGDDPINRLVVLYVIQNLSVDPQNTPYLLASTLGLVPILFELIHFEPGECRLHALATLENLFEYAKIPKDPGVDAMDMVRSGWIVYTRTRTKLMFICYL